MSEIKIKKSGLNFVDVLLIVLVLGAIGVVAYILLGKSADTGTFEITYTVEIPIIRNEIADEAMKYTPGDVVIDAVKAFTIGKLESITREDAYKATTNLVTGVMDTVKYPEHSKLTLTFKANAEIVDNSYMIKGYKIGVGTQVHFRTPMLINYGYCTSITVSQPQSSAAAPTSAPVQ